MLIPTAKNVKNITDFRQDPDSILESVQGKSDPIYLFRGSEPKAVVLDIEEYARLAEALEDYQDYLLIEDIISDPDRFKKGVPLEEVLKNSVSSPSGKRPQQTTKTRSNKGR
jgi:prevent-host-death family protein